MVETPKFENIYTKEQNEQKKDHIKKLESNDQNLVKLDKNIKKIENKLSKLGDKGADFFQKIMNDYLKEKYGAYFEQKDGHLVLIVDKQQKDYIQKLDELATELKINGNDIFVDKDGNNKMDKDEMGLKINEKEKKLEANAIYVDNQELSNKTVSFGKVKESIAKYGLGKKISEYDVQVINNLIGQINSNLGDTTDFENVSKFRDFKFENTPEGIKKLYEYVDFLSKRYKKKSGQVDDPFENVLSNYDKVNKLLKKLSTTFAPSKETKVVEKQRQILDKEYTHGGGLIYENGKVYYQVGESKDKKGNYDHLSAVSRLFTALSEEFFDGMNLKEINKKIENLYFNPKSNEFKIFDNGHPEPGYEKVGDINSKKWWSIVKPGAKINISSLAEAISPKPKQPDQNKIDSKETKNILEGWGRFYFSGGKEIWDIPDNKTVNYFKYGSSQPDYSGLKGNQISISADSVYDFGNKHDNNFSIKYPVKVGGEDAFLLAGENLSGKKIQITYGQKIDSEDFIKNQFKDSKTEAWLVIPDKKGNWNIKEVGDKTVHTITETSDTVEKGKDVNHPIIAEKCQNKSEWKVHFEGEINGNLTFEKASQKDAKNTKKNKENHTDKDKFIIKFNNKENISKEEFQKMFGTDKAYVAIGDKVYELSFDEKNKKIKAEEKQEYKEDISLGGVSINLDGLTGFEYSKDHISFPEVEGWGKISGKIEKEKGEPYFILSEKIAGNEIKIKLDKEKMEAEEIFQDITYSLLSAVNEETLSSIEGKSVSNEKFQYDSIKHIIILNYNLKDYESIKDKKKNTNAENKDILDYIKNLKIPKNGDDYIMKSIERDIAKKLGISIEAEKKVDSDKAKKINQVEENKDIIKLDNKELSTLEDILNNISLSKSALKALYGNNKDKDFYDRWLSYFDKDVSIHEIKVDQSDKGLNVTFDFDDNWTDEEFNKNINVDFSQNELKNLKPIIDKLLNEKIKPEEKKSALNQIQLKLVNKIEKEAIPQAVHKMKNIENLAKVEANLDNLKNIDPLPFNSDDLGIKDKKLKEIMSRNFDNGLVWLKPVKDKISYNKDKGEYNLTLYNSKLGEFYVKGKSILEINEKIKKELSADIVNRLKAYEKEVNTQEIIKSNILSIKNNLEKLDFSEENLAGDTSDKILLKKWLSLFDGNKVKVDNVDVEKVDNGYNFIIEFDNKGLNRDFNKSIKVFVSNEELKNPSELTGKLVSDLGDLYKKNNEFHDKYASIYIYHQAVKKALDKFKEYNESKLIEESISKIKSNLNTLELYGQDALTSGNKKLLEFIGSANESINVDNVIYDKDKNELSIVFSNEKKLTVPNVSLNVLTRLSEKDNSYWKKTILSHFEKS